MKSSSTQTHITSETRSSTQDSSLSVMSSMDGGEITVKGNSEESKIGGNATSTVAPIELGPSLSFSADWPLTSSSQHLPTSSSSFSESQQHPSTMTMNDGFVNVTTCELAPSEAQPAVSGMLRADFFLQGGFSTKFGSFEGTFLERKFSKESDAEIEAVLQQCDAAMDEDMDLYYEPFPILHIKNLVLEDDENACGLTTHLLQDALCQISNKFTMAVVQLSAASTASCSPGRLVFAAHTWITLQRVGFRALTGNRDFLLLHVDTLRTRQYNSSNVLPFLASIQALRDVDDKDGSRKLSECIREIAHVGGIADEPELLSRTKFVMDEWGYIGRVKKHSSDSTDVYWGHHWDVETFKHDDIKLELTRGIIPCELDILCRAASSSSAPKATSPKKRSRDVDVFINSLNVKVWKKGNGW